jgi:hypothetical protein
VPRSPLSGHHPRGHFWAGCPSCAPFYAFSSILATK